MEIKIDSKVNNSLLERTEVYFSVKHTGEGTPNREIIRSELAEKLNAKKENVIVNDIKTCFGQNVITGYAKIYNSLEKSKEIEPDYILVRNKLMEKVKKSKKKKGEASAPQKERATSQKPPAEKPVEKKPEAVAEKKASDKPAGDSKGETHLKEAKPEQKAKDAPK